jgi:hypothetical protein
MLGMKNQNRRYLNKFKTTIECLILNKKESINKISISIKKYISFEKINKIFYIFNNLFRITYFS